jgi:hypothetical protein
MIDVANKPSKNYDPKKLLVLKPSPELIDSSSAALQRFYNATCQYEMGLIIYDSFLEDAKNGAVTLMSSITKEFDLKR